MPSISSLSRERTIVINEDDPHTTATFTVPERLLTEHSTFFQSACRDASGEAATVIKLPQVDPDAFRAYLSWVHGGTLTFTINSDSQGASASDLYPISLALVKLWLLADRLTTTKLRNDTRQALHRVFASLDHTQGSPIEIFPPSITVLIWPATTKDRSLRNIAVDHYASKVPIPQIDKSFQEFQPGFVTELTQKIVEMHKDPNSNLPTTQVNGDSTTQVNGHGHHAESAPPNPPRPNDTVAQPGNPPATHSPANIILKDRLGNTLRASCASFDTLNHTVSAMLPLLHDRTGDVEKN